VSLDPPVCSQCAGHGELPNAADAPEEALFGAERCPASPTPALHAPIWTSDTEGYCARCKFGFAA
jgi:hypothetical protein